MVRLFLRYKQRVPPPKYRAGIEKRSSHISMFVHRRRSFDRLALIHMASRYICFSHESLITSWAVVELRDGRMNSCVD
jgi:hypothetical protein